MLYHGCYCKTASQYNLTPAVTFKVTSSSSKEGDRGWRNEEMKGGQGDEKGGRFKGQGTLTGGLLSWIHAAGKKLHQNNTHNLQVIASLTTNFFVVCRCTKSYNCDMHYFILVTAQGFAGHIWVMSCWVVFVFVEVFYKKPPVDPPALDSAALRCPSRAGPRFVFDFRRTTCPLLTKYLCSSLPPHRPPLLHPTDYL